MDVIFDFSKLANETIKSPLFAADSPFFNAVGIDDASAFSTAASTQYDVSNNIPTSLVAGTERSNPVADQKIAASNFLTESERNGGATTSAITVADGAVVEINGASGQSITFAATTGTVKLEDSVAFTGQVSGLTGSDALDLADVHYGANTTATFLGNANGGTLTVTDGTNTTNIALQGNYLSSSWTLSSDGNGGTLVVDPVTPNNWQTLNVGAGGWLTGIDVAPDGTMVARTDTYGAYIWNGTEWQQLVTSTSMPAGWVAPDSNSQGVYEIQIAPSNSNIMYMMYDGYVFESTNKGTTWTETSFSPISETTSDSYRHDGQMMAIDPENSNVVYVGTPQNGLFVTTNAGATWQNVTAVPVSATNGGITGIEFDPALGVTGGKTNTIFAASYGNGVYESTNGGTSWSAIGGPSDVLHAAVSTTGVYYATDGTTLWSYQSGGWTQLLSNNTWGVETVAVNPLNPNELVVQADSGQIDVSYNGGKTWSGYDSNYQLSATDVPWLATTGSWMSVGGTVFSSTVPNELIVSAGVGVWTTTLPTSGFTSSTSVTWTSQSAGIEQLVANEIIVPPGGDPVLASWDRPFFYISNANAYAASYSPNTGNTLAEGWSVDYASSNPSFIVGIADNWGVEQSGYSTDGGQTWTPFASFIPGAGTNFIGGTIAASSSTNFVWAPAGGEDPYYTLNGGITWNPITLPGVSDWQGFDFSSSFDTRTVTADRVLPNTFYLYDPGIWSGTSYNQAGVFETTNGGVSWTEVYNGQITPYSMYNSELQAVPGEAGNLFFTGGIQSGYPTEPFMFSRNGGATWTAVPNVTEVNCFGFGAPAPGQSYPSIYIVGYVNSVYGIWQSNDDAKSWVQIGTYPAGDLDQIKTISGDPNAYGQVYVGFAGSGYAYLPAASATATVVAPAAPTVTSFSPDSGTVGDGITNATVLTLTGTAAAGSTVTVFDGTTQLGTATANASGAWSFATGALANGTHSFTATGTDTTGNTSAASTALNVTVDTVAPAAPTVTSFSPDSGTVGDGITNATVLTLTGTAAAGSTVTVFDGGKQIGTATANANGAWNFTTATLAANATHSFTATAADAAGNASAVSAALNVTVDTLAPAAPTIASFSPDSGTVGDGITNATVLTLTGTAAAGSTVTVFDGGKQIGTATANSSGAWNFTTATLAANASHSFTAMAADAAGNTSAASSALAVTVDTVAPNAPVITSDTIVNTNEVTLAGTAEANSTVTVFDGATELGTTLANASGTWSYTTGHLSNGAHAFAATDTDAAGNISVASQAVDPTIGTAPPAAPKIGSFSPDTGTVGDGITDHAVLTLSGTAEANSTVTVFDGNLQLGTATVNGNGVWNFTTGTLANGAHSFTTTDTDAAGTSAASSVLAVTVDTIAPTPAFNNIVSNSHGTVTLSGTSEAGSVLSIYDGTSTTPLGTVTASANGSWSFTTAKLSNTVHSFTLTAVDVAGNTGVSSGALIYGSTSSDTIKVGPGNDLVTGHGGNDTFVFGTSFGNDVITDFQVGNRNHDVLQFSHNTFSDFATVLAHAAQVGSNVVITADAADTVTLMNVHLSSLQKNDIHIV